MEWQILSLVGVLAGAALLVFEVFMPGFGVPGIAGIGLLVMSVVVCWTKFGVLAGVTALILAVALAGIAIAIAIRTVEKGKTGKNSLILEGNNAGPENEATRLWLGKTGVAKTPLRPVGTAEIEDEKITVSADNEFISAEEKIKVTRVENGQIFVKKA